MKLAILFILKILFISLIFNFIQFKRIKWLEEEKNIMLTLYGEQLIKLPLSEAEKKIIGD